MTKRNRLKMDKNNVRDALTGKRISPNKEVIEIANAIDYVKKMGFLILRPVFDKKKLQSAGLGFIFIMLLLFAILPMVSATKYSAINSYANWTFDNFNYPAWDTGTDNYTIGNITFTGGTILSGLGGCIDSRCVNVIGSTGNINNPEVDKMNGTLALWIRPQDLTGDKIIWQSVGGGTANSGLYMQVFSNGSIVGFADGGGTEISFGFAMNLTLGAWTHFAIKINGTGIYGYHNGSKVGEYMTTGKGFFRTGAGNPIFLQSTDVIYDEAKFFNTELSDSDIHDMWLTEITQPVENITPSKSFITSSQLNAITTTTSTTFSDVLSINYTTPFVNNTNSFAVVTLGSSTIASGSGAVGEWRLLENGIVIADSNKTLTTSDAYVIKMVSLGFDTNSSNNTIIQLQHRRISGTTALSSYNASIVIHGTRDLSTNLPLDFNNFSITGSTSSTTYTDVQDSLFNQTNNNGSLILLWDNSLQKSGTGIFFYQYRVTKPDSSIVNCTELQLNIANNDLTSTGAGCVIQNTAKGIYNISLFVKNTAGSTNFHSNLNVMAHVEAGSSDIDSRFRLQNAFINTTFRRIANVSFNVTYLGEKIYSSAGFLLNFSSTPAISTFQIRVYNGTGGLVNQSLFLNRVAPTTSLIQSEPLLQYANDYNYSLGNYSIELWGSLDSGTGNLVGGSFIVLDVNSISNFIISPPTAPLIYNPLSATYSDGISINYTQSVSPQGQPLLFYNITLRNQDFTLNASIQENNSLNLSYIWNSSLVHDGDYRIAVTIYSSTGLSATGFSEQFTVRNHPFLPTAATGLFTADFTTLQGVVIFLIELAIAAACYIFINRPLGSLFIMLVGFVALVNQNLFIGVMLIFIAFGLGFIPDKK